MHNLFIGNVSFAMTEGELECELSKFGDVVDVHILRGDDGQSSRGVGFARMRDDSAVAAAIRARGFKYLGRQCYIRPYRVPVREGRPPLPANVAQPASVDPFPSRPAGGDGDPVPVPAPASQVDDAAAGRPTVIPYGKFAGVLIATLCNDDLVQARRELARVYPGAQGAIMSEISRRQNAARNREAARAGRQRRSPRRW